MMRISVLCQGPFGTNCYIVEDEGECILIDAPYPASTIIAQLEKLSLTPSWILLTHGHFDHVLATGPLKEKYPDIRIAVSAADAAYLASGGERVWRDISYFSAEGAFTAQASGTADDFIIVDEESKLPMGFRLIMTPGHTEGGVCYYNEKEKVLFSGDTLFRRSVGRTDLEGGNQLVLASSLRKLAALPPDTLVLPGHGNSTTISEEVRENPYIG